MSKLILFLLFVLSPITALAGELNSPNHLMEGSEVRCLSGASIDEFSEANYAGAYTLRNGECIFIEDTRAAGGHLILHAECLGLHCPLFRFNDFIYVYGGTPGDKSTIQGTVTFMSDGYRINQLILQHEGKEAYFPRRQ